MNLRRNILIFHQAALGDFVLTWPLAMALGRVFAQSRVMYVTGSDKGRLAEDAIGVEAVSADDGWHALHGDGVEPNDHVRRMLAATQLVVLFAQNDEPSFAAGLHKNAGDVPMVVLRPNPPADVHVWDHHLAQLAGDGRLADYVRQMQSLVRTQGLIARLPSESNTVFIHPGSGSIEKNWPVELFAALGAELRGRGKKVALLLGEAERERFDAASRSRLSDAADEVIEPADLPALRRTLTAAAAYVGNDSGPTHLAAMLGVPTVALFGPASSPAQWHPVGPRAAVCPFDTSVGGVVDQLLSLG